MNKISSISCAVISCNVSYKNRIDEKTLLVILRKEAPIGIWLSHMSKFFNEVPEKHIIGFLNEAGITLNDTYRLFYSMPEIYQENHFKEIYHAHQ